MDLVGPYYIILFMIAIAIVFVNEIPYSILDFINSIWGKLIFIVLLFGFITKGHNIIALLIIIFYFKVLFEVNKKSNQFGKISEGFIPGGITNHHIVEKDNRWLVEKMLNERPYLIEDSVITTGAIQ